MNSACKPTRRRTIIYAAAALSSLAMLTRPDKSLAAGTLPKANAKYQDTPKGVMQCSKCNYYLPGATGKPSLCKIVAGPISPTGYCTMYAAKRG